MTTLHFAANNGQQDSVRLILTYALSQKPRSKATNHLSLDIELKDARSRDGRTPLFLAVESGNDEVVHLLLDHGASTTAHMVKHKSNKASSHFESLLSVAVRNDTPLVIKELLLFRDEIPPEDLESALSIGVSLNHRDSVSTIAQWAFNHGQECDPQDKIVKVAIDSGTIEILKILLSYRSGKQLRRILTPIYMS